jgi:Ca2+-binding RTX toxin-like protein
MAKTVKNGTQGSDHLLADYGNPDGTILNGYGGNDIIAGGNGNDIIVGGQGDDQMGGGKGADIFRFFGDDIVSLGNTVTGNETDNIRDLNFVEGDSILLDHFSEFTANMSVKSFANIVTLVNSSHWYATDIIGNENLKISYNFGEGKIENIVITVAPTAGQPTAQAQYEAAGGTYGTDGAWNGGEGFELGLLIA